MSDLLDPPVPVIVAGVALLVILAVNMTARRAHRRGQPRAAARLGLASFLIGLVSLTYVLGATVISR